MSDAYHLSCAHICEAASILAGIVFAALPWASSPLAFFLLGFLLGPEMKELIRHVRQLGMPVLHF